MDELKEQLRLHVAGATVRHKSGFEDLPSYKNVDQLSQDFIKEWVVPFYMEVHRLDTNWSNQLIQVKNLISKDIVLKLLGDFNWRTRKTGAFFAALKNFTDLTDIIGTHLLKSEVCYAGKVYAYTLASFNTPKCVGYLDNYLTYYLLKKNLWFDQYEAMEALIYLDKINNTNLALKHLDAWNKFIEDKPNWKKVITTEKLEAELGLIEKVRQNDTSG